MAFFDSHHPKRFGAIRHGVKFLPRLHQAVHHCSAKARGHGDFKGQFTRKRNSEQTGWRAAADGCFRASHEAEAFI